MVIFINEVQSKLHSIMYLHLTHFLILFSSCRTKPEAVDVTFAGGILYGTLSRSLLYTDSSFFK